MRSKNNKDRDRSKKRAAYRRGEKIFIFLKRGVIALSALALIGVIILAVRISLRSFYINNIVISGNNHIEDYEIKDAIDIRAGENLMKLSFDEIETRLKRLAWIRKMSLRKEFPDTLMVNVEEASPKALLKFKGRLFIIGSEGRALEEIREKGTSFLPVIVEIDPEKDKGGIMEALKLIDAMAEKNILPGKESIEIMLAPYGLSAFLDGESLRIGYGEYADKIGKWKELEPEIRKKNMIVDYVDLRFKDRVIVKPFKMTANNIVKKAGK
ncbi:MAG: FtsQ-type POTRA domain-containing protein [Nitrospirae bacterium]|nr:FtsQ-type POTRA domain-containing protein [Nitrospirota bacterium]